MVRRAFAIMVLTAACLGGCASPRMDFVRRGFDGACAARPAFAEAAQDNARSLDSLALAPFGAEETGWRVYAPAVAVEIGTTCPPESQAFAAALARWGATRGQPKDGRMDAGLFERMKSDWQERRGFVLLRAQGICPEPPTEAGLVHLGEDEPLMGKPLSLTPEAAKALRRLRAAARRDLALPAGDPTLMAFSAYRSPSDDAARCEREGNCDGVARAQCSAHRTGLAVDLALGAAPGHGWDSSATANRLFQTSAPAYRWMLAKAGRFGFVNYAFEPWHWEWSPARAAP